VSPVVDADTGELLGQLTVPELNHRMVELSNALDLNTAELRRLAAEKERVDLTYRLHFAAAVAASGRRSADQRKAEAEQHCASVPAREGTAESLAHAASRLDMQLKAEREAGHNIRSQLSAMQSVASNLRSEISGLGYRP